jgi:lysozyme
VLALQVGLNRQGSALFHPPIGEDSHLGPETGFAVQAIGFALGFADDALKGPQIGPVVQQLIADPGGRGPGILTRARARAPQLHERTIVFDGVPTYWGLAKPLLLAREHGWGGSLSSSDRRPGVAERFGHKSQATLFDCFQRSQQLGRCPADCGGDCNPANPPGASSHEQLSDAKGFPGPVGRQLQWWELGLDVEDSDRLLAILGTLGYQAKRTYPNSPKEFHHLNFTADPGPVLPTDGPAAKPAQAVTPVVVVTKPAVKPAGKPVVTPGVKVSLTGPDVSLNQPDVDWAQVAGAGHTFGIAKATDGLGTRDDKFGKGRWKAMKDAGLVRGAYHFARPQKGRDPKDEVAEYLACIADAGGLQPGDLVPLLDVEAYGKAGKLTAPQTLEWVRGWVTEMRARIGRFPVIYTGSFWRDDMANPGDNLGCPLWLAAYVKKADMPGFVPVAWQTGGVTLWQFTSTGKCPGIAGGCDLSRFDGPQSSFDALRL